MYFCRNRVNKIVMKSVTAFLYIENPETEKIVLESIRSFKTLEIIDSVTDKFSFLEKAGAYCPDLMFIEFVDQIESTLDLFGLLTKPIFSIAICEDPAMTQRFLDKGFFDVICKPISKDQLIRKIYKVMKMSSDIVQRFKGVSTVASPSLQYPVKNSSSKTVINSVYLKYKNTRVKVPFDDIIYISSVKELLVVVTDSGSRFFHQTSLKKFLTYLPESKFIRVNNATAVNFHKIETLTHNLISLGTNNEFTVSRMYLSRLKEILRIKAKN